MKAKKSLLSIAIALVFVFFIGYGIEVFYDSPQYEDYCPRNSFEIANEAECVKAGGEWIESKAVNEPAPVKSFCRESKACRDSYTNAQEGHDKYVFIIALIAGLIAVIVGVIYKMESVSTGIVGGGVLSILYGTIRYWQHANDVLKFVLLGIALVLLIWLGIKKLDKKK